MPAEPEPTVEGAVLKLLRDEVMINAEKLERQCAGAGHLFAVVFLETMAGGVVDADTLTFCSPEKRRDVFRAIRTGLAKKYVEKPTIVNQTTGKLKVTGEMHEARRIAATALNAAGLLGAVTVEKYHDINGGAESIIRRSAGYQFRIELMRTFMSSLTLGEFDNWEANQVRVLIVDGVISSVAEIDKILLGATRTKQPLVILASYFEEEVVATVAANNLAGRCNVFLCLLPRDSLDSVNMANDIATCCLASTINAHGGHGMLSFLEFESLPIVSTIRVATANGAMTITNPQAHAAVMAHVKRLQEKLAELARDSGSNKAKDASMELVNKRIANLMGDRVVVGIPSSYANVQIPAIDTEIRLIKSLLEHGQLTNTGAMHDWLRRCCDQMTTGGYMSCVAKLLTTELNQLRKNKILVPGIAPYLVLWFVGAISEQYLNAGAAVIVRS